jgi:dCMP deaminase
MKRISKEEYFMSLAIMASLRSTCLHRKVGCIFIDANGHVLSTGYNGAPREITNCCDSLTCTRKKSGEKLDECLAVHAEQNAIIQCKDNFKIATVYCTNIPCPTCYKMILNTSAVDLFYLYDYKNELIEKDVFAFTKLKFNKVELSPFLLNITDAVPF